MKTENKIIGAGLFTGIAASLCCITPLLAIVAGTSGIASSFSWLEPMRPYFIGLTILIIAFSWYQKLKTKKQIDCNCDIREKSKFINSKVFLAVITVFAVLMLSFPYYSNIFYTNKEEKVLVSNKSSSKKAEFAISGMNCASCEKHVNNEVNKLAGIINLNANYTNGNAIVEFDNSKITLREIEKAINSTGYTVTNKKLK